MRRQMSTRFSTGVLFQSSWEATAVPSAASISRAVARLRST